MKLLRIKLFTKFENNYRKLLADYINSNSTIREGGIRGLTKRDAVRTKHAIYDLVDYINGKNLSEDKISEISILAKNAGLAPTEELAKKNIKNLISKYNNKRSWAKLINTKVRKGKELDTTAPISFFDNLFPSKRRADAVTNYIESNKDRNKLEKVMKEKFGFDPSREIRKKLRKKNIAILNNKSKELPGSYTVTPFENLPKSQDPSQIALEEATISAKKVASKKDKEILSKNKRNPYVMYGSADGKIKDGAPVLGHEGGHAEMRNGEFVESGENFAKTLIKSLEGGNNPKIELLNDARLADETLASLKSTSKYNREVNKLPESVEEEKERLKSLAAKQLDNALVTYKDFTGDRLKKRPELISTQVVNTMVNNKIKRRNLRKLDKVYRKLRENLKSN